MYAKGVFTLRNILLFAILPLHSLQLFGQQSPTPITSAPKEKMICEKMDLQIDGSIYNDAFYCETKDAVCYMIEGFSMSCVRKEHRQKYKLINP
ncbi:hypothetical protein CH373_10745 [Leptospira perolatii]|uniref:Uncharacterized protein n=2 Tax=Leptospira perolatii TaxID=2023191 RepID=A0A2M9ZM41_9LEPT|nr:hypothetical protein CH360_09490 [Leptospira perolatii]PJZ73160.1 hypothetical protein CH373_10745 [Leptospira perolatii]